MSSSSEAESSEKSGLKFDVMSKVRILANARSAKLPIKKEATIKEAVLVLAKHYEAQQATGTAMAVCERCNGIGPEAVDNCPFCGEPNVNEESQAGESMPDPESAVARGVALEKRSEANLSVNVKPMAPLARVLPRPTESQLEEAVGRIQKFKRTLIESAWDIGNELRAIAEDADDRPALWRLRVEDDGKTPSYKSFKDFLRAEVGFSYEMARTLMYLAQEYSREQITLTGTAKIAVVLNAPAAEHKRLLAEVNANATPIREVRERVKALNLATGAAERKRVSMKKDKDGNPVMKKDKEGNPVMVHERPGLAPARVAARQKRAEEENAAKDEAKGVTTFVLEGKKARAWLWKKEKDKKGKLVPAVSPADAWGWLEGKNGTKLSFVLEKVENAGCPSGQLRVVFKAERDEEAAEG